MRFVLRAAHAVLVAKDGVRYLDIRAILRRRRGELHHHLGLLAEAERSPSGIETPRSRPLKLRPTTPASSEKNDATCAESST